MHGSVVDWSNFEGLKLNNLTKISIKSNLSEAAAKSYATGDRGYNEPRAESTEARGFRGL